MKQVKVNIDDDKATISLYSSGSQTFKRMDLLLRGIDICSVGVDENVTQLTKDAKAAVDALQKALEPEKKDEAPQP